MAALHWVSHIGHSGKSVYLYYPLWPWETWGCWLSVAITGNIGGCKIIPRVRPLPLRCHASLCPCLSVCLSLLILSDLAIVFILSLRFPSEARSKLANSNGLPKEWEKIAGVAWLHSFCLWTMRPKWWIGKHCGPQIYLFLLCYVSMRKGCEKFTCPTITPWRK